MTGNVTKIELFGAFVDVGAEVEGLIHISRLQPGRVNRVEDVIQEGQEVDVWVHRVDPNAKRLELAMVRPVQLKWKDIKSGMKFVGTVVRIEDFGAFVDIGAERPGLVHVSEMSSEYVSNPADVATVGEEYEVTVLDVDRKKKQIRLSMKTSMADIHEEEEEEEIPTAMAFALQQALAKSPEKNSILNRSDLSPKKKHRKDQDDIQARTLAHRMRTSSSDR